MYRRSQLSLVEVRNQSKSTRERAHGNIHHNDRHFPREAIDAPSNVSCLFVYSLIASSIIPS